MEKMMECAFCDGKALLRSEVKEFSYKKEAFSIHQYYYVCRKCHEEFTTTAVDEFSVAQVHNQYRAKHAIPFVEEIIRTKEKYELPASKMNEVLGLGANSYSNFEKGDMPSAAMANLLTLAKNPAIFRQMVLNTKDVFSDHALADLLKRIDYLLCEEGKQSVRIDAKEAPSSLNGFRAPSLERIVNMFAYYLTECKHEFNDKLKLNKLFFYTDFFHFSQHGRSVSGLSYRAIPHGPAPSYYDVLFTHLLTENYIQNDWEASENKNGIEIYNSADGYDLNVFSKEEKESLQCIAVQFKDISSWDLRNLSHLETGWKECFPSREIIDYQKYAFDLTIQ